MQYFEENEQVTIFHQNNKLTGIDIKPGTFHREYNNNLKKTQLRTMSWYLERYPSYSQNIIPLAFCRAYENCIGLNIPSRAKYLRAIVTELHRVNSHLFTIANIDDIKKDKKLDSYLLFMRDLCSMAIEQLVAGNSLKFNYFVPGGVSVDPSQKQLRKVDEISGNLFYVFQAIREYFGKNHRLIKKLSKLEFHKENKEIISEFNASGIFARTCNIEKDARLNDDLYLANGFKIITNKSENLFMVVQALLDEVKVSISLTQNMMASLPNNEHYVEPQAIIYGQGYGFAESPTGTVYVGISLSNSPVADNIIVRTPEYINLQALNEILNSKNYLYYKTENLTNLFALISPTFMKNNKIVSVESEPRKKELESKNIRIKSFIARKRPYISNDTELGKSKISNDYAEK